MKKVLSVALGLSMALSVLVGCGGAPSQSTAPVSASEGTSASQSEAAPEAEPAKITVAYHPHITGVGGLLNAIDDGYFEAENLEIELVQFTSGATELAAMASARRRFSSPSDRGCSMGSCAPVSTTGMGMPRTMKDKIAAV